MMCLPSRSTGSWRRRYGGGYLEAVLDGVAAEAGAGAGREQRPRRFVPARSASQALSTVRMVGVSGVRLCLRPLPIVCTLAPVPSVMSRQSRVAIPARRFAGRSGSSARASRDHDGRSMCPARRRRACRRPRLRRGRSAGFARSAWLGSRARAGSWRRARDAGVPGRRTASGSPRGGCCGWDAVAASVLEVFQERADQRRVELPMSSRWVAVRLLAAKARSSRNVWP